MRKSLRYVIYMMVGFIIYQLIDSGETSFSHQDARNWLLGAIVVIFILMIVVRVLKQRYDK